MSALVDGGSPWWSCPLPDDARRARCTGERDPGEPAAAVPQVVSVHAGLVGGTEDVHSELVALARERGFGEGDDRHPVIRAETARRVDVAGVAAAGDVEPGDELLGLVGLVVLVGDAPLLSEAEQDRLDEVRLPGGDVAEREGLFLIGEGGGFADQQLAEVLPVVLGGHPGRGPVDGQVGPERVASEIADVAVGVVGGLGEFEGGRVERPVQGEAVGGGPAGPSWPANRCASCRVTVKLRPLVTPVGDRRPMSLSYQLSGLTGNAGQAP